MPTAPPIADPTAAAQQASPGAQLVDRRVRQASRALVAGDLASALVTLLIGSLVFLAVAALLEHWVTTSGLRRSERWGLWLVGMIGLVAYSARRIGPLLLRRINPLYAASQIENEAPTLKNSLVNLLQLSGAPKSVRATLEQQAAQRLRDAGDTSLDRSSIVRLGYVLLALVVAMGAYTIVSPKNLFVSAARIAAPWIDLSAPTRVSIDDLTPGDAEVNQGDTVEVSARVVGLDADDSVELVYTTADGRLEGARLSMRPDESGVRYRATLPAGGSDTAVLGLQSDVVYRLEAGDARTEPRRLRVIAAPTIAPVAIQYDYPVYTGYLDRTVEGGGDIRAIEGTRVTVTAAANLPIEAAQIDRGADGTPDVRMTVEGQRATGQWTLRVEGDALRDTSTYVLRFSTPDGAANTEPPVYRIETLADLDPEVRIVAPEEPQLMVGLDDAVEFRVDARDPDFALSAVRLMGEVQGRRRVDEPLFESRSGVAPHEGPLEVAITRTPRELGLQPGQTLEYRFVANDNRRPKPNTATTITQKLVVAADNDPRPGEGDPEAGANGRPDPNSQQQPGEGQQADSDNSAGDAAGDAEGQQPDNNAPQQPGQNQPQQGGDQQQSGQQDEGDEQGQGQEQPGGLKGPGGNGQNGANEQQSGGSPTPPAGQSGENNPSGPPSQGGSPSGGGRQSQNSDAAGSDQPGANDSANSDSSGQRDGDNQNGQGDPSEGEPSGGDQPVARDGSDDGAAFDRIRDHFADQQSSGEESSSKRSSPEGSSDESASQGAKRDGQQGEPERGGGEQPGGADQGANPREQGGQSPDRNSEPSGDGAGQRGEQSDSATSDGGGETASGRPTDPTAGPREGTGESGENQAADQGTGQSGDRGAGESSGQPGEQQQAAGETGASSGDRPGNGSKSREAEDGKRRGGGEQPGQAGDDASGEGQPSRNGRSDSRRDDQRSGDERGSRNERSDGAEAAHGQSKQGQSKQGQRGEGQPGEQTSSDRGDQQWRERQEDGPPGDRGEQGGSEATDTSQDTNRNGAPDEPGDAANLEYARRQTELTLEKLSDQLARGEADRELLEKLGWTENDLRRFVERWQARKTRAERSREGAAELDSALRSLGLRPNQSRGKQTVRDDELRDLRQGPRTPPPPALLERLRSYNRGVSGATLPAE